jgi:uncharacterized membrane protein
MPEIHYLFIHFPIALFSSAIVFDILYVLTRKNDLAQTGWWVMFTALVSAAGSITTGIWQDSLVGHFGSVVPLWVNHGWVQIFSCLIFLCLFVWRTKHPGTLTHPNQKWVYAFIGGLAVTILFYGGHLGAKLAGRI